MLGVLAVVGVVAAAVGTFGLQRSTPTPHNAASTTSSTAVRVTQPIRRAVAGAPAPAPRPFYARGSVFPGLAVGSSLVGVSAAGTVVRFDPDDGGGLRRALPAGYDQGVPVTVLPRRFGVVLASTEGPSWFVPEDAAARPVLLPVGHLLAAADPGELWRVPSPRTAERLDAATGRTVAVHVLPAGMVPLADDGLGGLLLAAPGGTYRLDGRTGAVARVSDGRVAGVAGTLRAEVLCDERLACRLRVVQTRSGQVLHDRPLPATPPGALDRLGALSPDGHYLARLAPFARSLRLQVIDLATGRLADVARAGESALTGGPAWTPDGQRLVWVDPRGRLRAWGPRGVRATDDASQVPDLVGVAVVP